MHWTIWMTLTVLAYGAAVVLLAKALDGLDVSLTDLDEDVDRCPHYFQEGDRTLRCTMKRHIGAHDSGTGVRWL